MKTNSTNYTDGSGKDIPINKVAAIAAGLVYNDNITNFQIYSMYKDNI